MGFLQRLFRRGGGSSEQGLGRVEDYFAKVGVIALRLQGPLAVGDQIRVHGHTTDFSQRVESIQIEHESVAQAPHGASVGIKVKAKCRRGDHLVRLPA